MAFRQEGFLFGSLEEELSGKPRSKTSYSGALKGPSSFVDCPQKKVGVVHPEAHPQAM